MQAAADKDIAKEQALNNLIRTTRAILERDSSIETEAEICAIINHLVMRRSDQDAGRLYVRKLVAQAFGDPTSDDSTGDGAKRPEHSEQSKPGEKKDGFAVGQKGKTERTERPQSLKQKNKPAYSSQSKPIIDLTTGEPDRPPRRNVQLGTFQSIVYAQYPASNNGDDGPTSEVVHNTATCIRLLTDNKSNSDDIAIHTSDTAQFIEFDGGSSDEEYVGEVRVTDSTSAEDSD